MVAMKVQVEVTDDKIKKRILLLAWVLGLSPDSVLLKALELGLSRLDSQRKFNAKKRREK
jgi:hypothetical protein